MKKKPYSQLTIRKVPLLVADRIKILSAKEGKSMNTLSIEILQRGLGLEGEVPVNHDLDEFIGTWKNDPEFDGVLESMRNIEPELWK
ncbi:MAG TPA: hypothetical protein PLG79_03815 [Spirochaetales bacterium]|nr:hypothetical protein [Spirochaetales bacterium]HOV37826.1 hypothetical protein [Spirochaetales bacterium]